MEGWVAAVCFNTVEAAKLGLPKPQSVVRPHDPRFKGKLTMPHPASSGTGYFHVSAWIQMFGEAKAWAFMDRLHDNIAIYVHSGAQPCRLAAAGEFPVGISAETAAAERAPQGCADRRAADEGGRRLGHGYGRDPASGTKNLEAARRLMDFAASRKANELYATLREPGRHARHRQPTFPTIPAGVAESMIKNDFAWASDNRARILAEWTRRYEGKAAKKN